MSEPTLVFGQYYKCLRCDSTNLERRNSTCSNYINKAQVYCRDCHEKWVHTYDLRTHTLLQAPTNEPKPPELEIPTWLIQKMIARCEKKKHEHELRQGELMFINEFCAEQHRAKAWSYNQMILKLRSLL